MMRIPVDPFVDLLENAITDGRCEELLEFLCNSENGQYIDAVINTIGDNIKDILSTEPDSQTKVTNILSIILDVANISSFGPEQSEYLTRFLLTIAVDENCSIYNLKHVLAMLKSLLSDEHILEWSSTDESLFVPLKLLGVKLPEVGDHECQYLLLETLCKISETDRNFWSNMWFSSEKTSSMFLNLNADQFELDCRKFLNFVNRNAVNKRTFAFVAASISLGSIKLRKPYKSDFWVDFNYDTDSISFIFSSLDVENDKTWETMVVYSNMVEGCYIESYKSSTTRDLCITLICPCSQLLSLEDTSIAGLESQLIRISFFSFLDVQHHIEAIFKGNCLGNFGDVSDSQHSKQNRRASEPINIVCFDENQERVPTSQNHKQKRRASEPIEMLCASNPEDTGAASQNYKHHRASQSTELVCSSYPQETRTKSRSGKRRRVSESSTLIPIVDLQEEEITELSSCSNAMYNTKNYYDSAYEKENCGEFFGNDNEGVDENEHYGEFYGNDNEGVDEEEHGCESYGNDNEGIDDQNNLSPSNQRQEDREINTSFQDLSKSNVSEMLSDDGNEQNDHDSRTDEYNLIENINKKKGDQSCETRKNTKSYNKVHDSLHNQGEFGEDLNSNIEISSQPKSRGSRNEISSALPKAPVDKYSQCMLKASQNKQLLAVSRAPKRKSSQVSVDGCLQLTPKRSENKQLLAVSSASKRKSSQVSVDGCLQLTPKRSQNKQLLAVSSASKRKSSQVSVDEFLQSTPKRSENTDFFAVSNKFKRNSPQFSPIMAVNVNHVQQNVYPEINENGGQLEEEIINDFDIEAETQDYPTEIDMECDINLQSKKNKFIHGKKNKPKISRVKSSVRLIEAEESDNALISEPKKTHRRAAVKARKRNKVILEEKGSEISFEGSQRTNQQNKIQENGVFSTSSKGKPLLPRKRSFFESENVDDEVLENNAPKSVKRSKSSKTAKANSEKIDEGHDEYAYCTPPPLVKRRKSRKNSTFVTDTETGSSEVSWFSKFKLFETPKQSYSNRKKLNKDIYQKKHAKSKLQRDKKSLATNWSSSQRSKTSESGSRSKIAFSEIERFSLVIEKDKNYNLQPPNELSGLYRALNYDRQSSIEDSNVRQNYSEELDVANENENWVEPDVNNENENSVELDVNNENENLVELDVNNENENLVELDINNEFHISENVASNASMKRSHKRKYKSVSASTIGEVSDVINESTVLSKNKCNMKSTKGLGKNKKPTQEIFNGKKSRANAATLKYCNKGSRNIQNSIGNELDSITVSENQSKRLKESLCQESEKNVGNCMTKSQTTSKKTHNFHPNLPISLETVIEVSPFKRDKGIKSGRWISPNKIENVHERPILESKSTLTEESLSSFNDEKQGKKMHLDHFFESISSVSPNHQILDLSEVPVLSTTRKKSKTKPQHSISEENVMKDRFSKKKKPSTENHFSDITQEEYNIASPSLANKSLFNLEEEQSEKYVSNIEPPESPLQEPLPIFQKTPTKDKIPCENYCLMKPSVLHILSDEVSTLTHRLFSTLKKCMSDFREKMVALRVSIVNTADSMISNESKFTKKDLGSLARNCRESRIHIEKHLKKLTAMGNEYFESEKQLERRLSKKHKKAILKYTKSLQIAQSIADKALEDRFILKSRAFLKSFLKKMELV